MIHAANASPADSQGSAIIHESHSVPPLLTPHRVSWAAVAAGVTVVLVTQLLLDVLGIAIGANPIAPR